MHKLRVLSVIAALMVSAGAAQAAAVSFSFSNNVGNVPGTVSGTIFGLAESGTSAATSIIIDSAPAGLGVGPTPFDIFDIGFAEIANTVTIIGGVATDFELLFAASAGSTGRHFILGYGGILSLNNIQGQFGVVNLDGIGAITSRVIPGVSTVPEPSTFALAGLALAGIAYTRRRKQ